MLIARAPVRISFAGGATDFPAYYLKYGGMVVSATIDKYFYTFVTVNDAEDIQITSSDYHTFYRHRGNEQLLWDGDLALPRAILHHFGLERSLSMFLASEIPPGTGLGSSSAVAVAIVKALSTLCDQPLTKQEVAELACQIEIEKLAMPIGRQDQYAASFGGINVIAFNREGVKVIPLEIPSATLRALERSLMLFFTGSSRNSISILTQQKESSERNEATVLDSLHAIKAMAEETRTCLEQGDLGRFGEILHRSWQHKKRLADGITTPWIDECYELALSKGALGGKITGAGGGGFLMLYCDPQHQEDVTAALEGRGLSRMDFHFDFGGARILMNATRRVRSLPYRPRKEWGGSHIG